MVTSGGKTDCLVVNALAEEQDAPLSQLPDHRRLPPQAESVLTYYAARLPIAHPAAGDACYTLVVTCLVGMGRVEAAAATVDAIRTFSPRYVLLVGIAGGVAERGVRLGDVPVADQIGVTPWRRQRHRPRVAVQRAPGRPPSPPLPTWEGSGEGSLQSAPGRSRGESWPPAHRLHRPAVT